MDYTLSAGQLTFNPGDTSELVPLVIVNDSIDEADETVQITLSSPVNASLGTPSVHTYTIQDNDGGEGEGLVEGSMEGATEGQGEGLVEGSNEGSAEGQIDNPHTSDQDGNGQISLSELLRIIQFFNSGGFHCQAGTEDGYAPGSGSHSCTVHDSDYNPTDWLISLSELLRVIQFFNSGGYHYCPEEGTEDGFCPGLM